MLQLISLFSAASFFGLGLIICIPSNALSRLTSQLRPRFSSVIVFGDSLSDSGNLFRLSKQTWPADEAYHRGRLSDGPTWVEYLARDLGFFSRGAELINLACGGATTNNKRLQGRAGYNSEMLVPSVMDQVRAYLHSPTKKSMSRSLFVVSGGGNDAFWTLGGPVPQAESAALAAADLLVACRRLYKAGARYFLIPGVPSFSTIPYATDFQTSYAEPLGAFSDAFNAYLRKHASAANIGKDATVILWNQAGALSSYIEEKSKVPGWNVKEACLQGVYPGEAAQRELRGDASRFVYWDVFHPTTVTHRHLAKSALASIVQTIDGGSFPYFAFETEEV
ncbi:hypothetical protein V8E36_000124 [Tilletia maclaganii]